MVKKPEMFHLERAKTQNYLPVTHWNSSTGIPENAELLACDAINKMQNLCPWNLA